jgi:hypothetical protein
VTTQLETNSNTPFNRPAFMLRGKETKGNKGLVAGNASVYYDLASTSQELEFNPDSIARALQTGRRQTRFGLKSSPTKQLLLVDEAMGFSVTLSTALRTGAVYEGLDFSKPSSLRCVGGEFFRQYVKLLIEPSLTLLYRQGLAFNWPELGLVLQLAKGVPVALGFFRRTATVSMNYTQPLLISPGSSGCSGSGPDSPSFGLYENYARSLLTYGLKPLVAELSGFGVREEVLWDIAIETLLEVLQTFDRPLEAREHLFIEELAVPNLNGPASARDSLVPNPAKIKKGFSFNQGQVIFLKQSCCEKYRKKVRCSNCPGNRKLSIPKIQLQTV